MYCKCILSVKPSSRRYFINILRVSYLFKKLTITPNCYMSVLFFRSQQIQIQTILDPPKTCVKKKNSKNLYMRREN